MLSVRTKITAMTTIFLFIAMSIGALFSITTLRNISIHDADQTLLVVGVKEQEYMNAYIKNIQQSVSAISSYAEADLAAMDSLDDAKLQAHMDRVSNFFSVQAQKTPKIRTYYYRLDPAVSQTVKGFWYVSDGEGIGPHEVTDITRYDKWDTSKLVWFTVPRNTGQPVWLPPYITDTLGARVVSYNVPIYYHNEFIGVIGIEIDYSTMAKHVDNIKVYEHGYAFLNDNEGNIIYHPHIDIATESQPQVPVGMTSNNKFFEYTYQGVEKHSIWLPLESGLRLNITVPVSEINAGWHKWSFKIITVFALLLAIFFLLTRILVKVIIPPHKN